MFTEEINNAIKVLFEGGLILYPTDMSWGIGCDATNDTAVDKILSLKRPKNVTALTCLVSNDAMLERYITKVPDLAYDLIDLSTKPITIVYDQPKGIAKNLIAPDNTLAFNVATDKFCQYLIGNFKKPLVFASANFPGGPIPKNFKEITEAVLKGVDYVVNLQHGSEYTVQPSMIKLSNDGTVKVIRE